MCTVALEPGQAPKVDGPWVRHCLELEMAMESDLCVEFFH
jgi:hypothetical protein